MKAVYLDQQIVIESSKESEKRPKERVITDAIEAGRNRGITFPYSPVHVEEIAKAHHQNNRRDAENLIPVLEWMSDGWAIIGKDPDLPAILLKEDIRACLSRVQDGNGRDITEYAAEIDRRKKYSVFKNIKEKDKIKIIKSVENSTPDNVFYNEYIYSFIENMARYFGFRMSLETYALRTETFDRLFGILNAFGFRKEHRDEHIEGRMHDVSHAIYGSYADVFVTNDRKLRDSSAAVYKRVGIKTSVIDRKEFLELAGTWKS